jgi:hypothetical protein
MTYVHPETKQATRVEVSVPDRMAAARMIADRGWGKAPMYAPIEDADPLDLANRQAEQVAASFDERMDELAARRGSKAA